jgi:gliding motility-associatede transport system auxiliary component
MSHRLTFLLGVVGGVLAGAGVVIYGLAPERTALIATVEGLAAVCLTVFLVTHFELFREFSTRRATRLGLNSIVMIVLMGTILGILNFLATRHSIRWDLSETKRFTLAPQTARLLRELPREVKVTVFTSDQSPVRLAYRDLIDTYQAHTAKLTAEFVDPEKKPGAARQYGITRPDTAVLESGKQETRITSASEQELTNALLRVTKDEKKAVYFLTGHAEHVLEDGSKEGYSFLKEALERQGYTVRPLSLYESKTIPKNASVLVVGGPQKPVSPEEQLLLADYVRTGGRLLALLDPGSRASLDSTLAAWGLQADNRTVLDTQTILGGDLTMPVVNTYGSHEITQDLGQVFTMFPQARPVSFVDSKSNEWVFHPLAKSSPRSWARAGEVGAVRDFNPQKDTQGPLTLAALVVGRASPAEDTRQPAVLFVGDSDFASNAFLDFSGNTDFILHAVAWLAEEKDLVTIAPKDTRLGTLLLTAAQSNALFALQVLGLPGFFLLAGFAVWRRRRRL